MSEIYNEFSPLSVIATGVSKSLHRVRNPAIYVLSKKKTAFLAESSMIETLPCISVVLFFRSCGRTATTYKECGASGEWEHIPKNISPGIFMSKGNMINIPAASLFLSDDSSYGSELPIGTNIAFKTKTVRVRRK